MQRLWPAVGEFHEDRKYNGAKLAYSVLEAAALCSPSRVEILEAVACGELQVKNIGKGKRRHRLVIQREALEAWLMDSRPRPGTERRRMGEAYAEQARLKAKPSWARR